MRKPRSLVTLVAVVVALAVPGIAAAVDYGGIGGVPANPRPNNPRTKSIFIYQLKAGQQVSDGVRIYNNTDKPRVIAVYAVDSVLASGGAFSCAQQADPKVDVGNWIQLDNEQVNVEPHSSQVVPFKVTVPDKAAVGEHNGCIAMQDTTQAAQSSGKNGVVLGFRSAIRVAITIPGKIVKQLSISSIKVNHLKNGDYGVTAGVYNAGNVSLDTKVDVGLHSVVGTRLTHTAGTYPVLAHSTASWNFTFKKPFWGGWYRAQVTASYNNNPSTGLGANTNDKQHRVAENSGLFFTAPSAPAALIELAILLAVAAAVVWLVRRRQHATLVRQHWVSYTVKKHDTLNKLADKHHVPWKKLAATNRLKPPYHLEPGEKLLVPPKNKG